MKTKFIAALLVACLASVVAPAFASGYGPAPSYKPSVSAPMSQRGLSAQTLTADDGDAQLGYGGVSGQSQSAGRTALTPRDARYTHR